MSQLIGILVLLVTLFLTFALVTLFTMKFETEINTYMPFRTAFLVSHVLSGSALAKGDITFHKNLLDSQKLDQFSEDYESNWPMKKGKMPPEFATLCYHWDAKVTDISTNKQWTFGRPNWYDFPDNLVSFIQSYPADVIKEVEADPFSALVTLFSPSLTGINPEIKNTFAEAASAELNDMTYTSYVLPVSIVYPDGQTNIGSMRIGAWRVKSECAGDIKDNYDEALEDKIWRRHDELMNQRFG